MGYYAAGDWYRAGGFSLRKFFKPVAAIAKLPVVQTLGTTALGFVPGGTTALAIAKASRDVITSAAAPAVARESVVGTPGAVAAVAAGHPARKRRLRIRIPRIRLRRRRR